MHGWKPRKGFPTKDRSNLTTFKPILKRRPPPFTRVRIHQGLLGFDDDPEDRIQRLQGDQIAHRIPLLEIGFVEEAVTPHSRS